jgi:hypothetical protein
VGAPDRIARWSLGAAALAGTCIVLYFILDHYQHYYLEQEPIVFNYWMIFIECIQLAPLRVVFVFRRSASMMFCYTLVSLAILAWRIYYLEQYYYFGAGALLGLKFDSPLILSTLLGAVSLAIFLWALIRSAISSGSTLKG